MESLLDARQPTSGETSRRAGPCRREEQFILVIRIIANAGQHEIAAVAIRFLAIFADVHAAQLPALETRSDRATIVEHVTASDPTTVARLALMNHHFIINGSDSLTASSRALASLDRQVERQAAMMAYRDASACWASSCSAACHS